MPVPSVDDITHYGDSWWLGDGVMSALGHAGQRIDIFRKEQLIVVTLEAFPEPAYAPPSDHHRRNDVVAFTRLVRTAVT